MPTYINSDVTKIPTAEMCDTGAVIESLARQAPRALEVMESVS